LKGVKLRTTLNIFIAAVLAVLAGCERAEKEKETLGVKPPPLKEGAQLLTVDFKQGQSLRYQFISKRDIIIDWEPEKSRTGARQGTIDKSTESMEMVVTYTPIEVNPYALTTIKAAIESVKATRSKRAGGRVPARDAVEHLTGKNFTMKVNAQGKIEDYSQLDELIRQIGENAFRKNSRQGRIKEPDMIADFVAAQWFLWDSISSIKKPAEGVSIGQSWSSKLSVPTPMVMRKARDVTYKFDKIWDNVKGRLAVISSTYSLSDSVPSGWPVPYTGRFRMSGTFGFFRGYNILSLSGRGDELFNIDKGRTERYSQEFDMRLEAILPGPLGPNPRIAINQKLTMQIID
jgi:hypothetical protein